MMSGDPRVTQYLISVGDGVMVFQAEDLPDVAKAAQQLAREARDAGARAESDCLTA
jgi:Sec-independent protein translocase protein TatA